MPKILTMNKKHLLLVFVLCLIGGLFCACHKEEIKEPTDYRDKWVGEYECVEYYTNYTNETGQRQSGSTKQKLQIEKDVTVNNIKISNNIGIATITEEGNFHSMKHASWGTYYSGCFFNDSIVLYQANMYPGGSSERYISGKKITKP